MRSKWSHGQGAQEVTGFGMKDPVPLISALRAGVGEWTEPQEPRHRHSQHSGNSKVSLVSLKASLCTQCPGNPCCYPPSIPQTSHKLPYPHIQMNVICLSLRHGPGGPARPLPARFQRPTWCSPWRCWACVRWLALCRSQTGCGWWPGWGRQSPGRWRLWPHLKPGFESCEVGLWPGTRAAAGPHWEWGKQGRLLLGAPNLPSRLFLSPLLFISLGLAL